MTIFQWRYQSECKQKVSPTACFQSMICQQKPTTTKISRFTRKPLNFSPSNVNQFVRLACHFCQPFQRVVSSMVKFVRSIIELSKKWKKKTCWKGVRLVLTQCHGFIIFKINKNSSNISLNSKSTFNFISCALFSGEFHFYTKFPKDQNQCPSKRKRYV